MTTPDDDLDAAVRVMVDKLRGEYENGDTGIVTEWALIAHTASFADDGASQSAYYLAYSNGSMPDHRAIGLFEWAKHMVTHGEVSNGDRDA